MTRYGHCRHIVQLLHIVQVLDIGFHILSSCLRVFRLSAVVPAMLTPTTIELTQGSIDSAFSSIPDCNLLCSQKHSRSFHVEINHPDSIDENHIDDRFQAHSSI
jgi:hypothetical protein